MIISASRRTDIPCHYGEWFMRRVEEGYALTRNPMNHGQVRRVSMMPEDVDCIVFWTKDAQNMLRYLDALDRRGLAYYFQFTLTPYGRDMEPGLRDKLDIAATFAELSRRIGRARVLWRYDPIILNEFWTVARHCECFRRMCEAFCGATERVTLSFVDLYPKLKTDAVRLIAQQEMTELAERMGAMATECGLSAKACCEQGDWTRFGIGRAACVDPETVACVSGHKPSAKRDRNQRTGCGCCESVDIGAYDTCPNGCVYCYANRSAALVNRNRAHHDPASPLLNG